MTADERSFIAAIIADKANDTPRLAYADWLEERATTERCPACRGDTRHRLKVSDKPERYVLNMVPGTCSACSGSGRVPDGRAARAEFIRVQVELANAGQFHAPTECDLPITRAEFGACGYCKRWTPELEALRRRERELWMSNAISRFLPQELDATLTLRDDVTNTTRHYGLLTRGFISHLSLSWQSWRTHADAITRAQPIERVRATTRPAEFRDWSIDLDTGIYTHRDYPGIEFEFPTRNILVTNADELRTASASAVAGDVIRVHQDVTDVGQP